MEYRDKELTSEIINASYKVHNTLGYGFLEKIYHNAMLIELEKRGLGIESEKAIVVSYDGKEVGKYFTDIVVENRVVVELKAAEELNSLFEAQLLNYLKASGIKTGLIINFGPSVKVKRMVL